LAELLIGCQGDVVIVDTYLADIGEKAVANGKVHVAVPATTKSGGEAARFAPRQSPGIPGVELHADGQREIAQIGPQRPETSESA
jgi:hypothetical protein